MRSIVSIPVPSVAYKSTSSAERYAAFMAPWRVLAAITWSAPWDEPSVRPPR